ncbi:MAG: cysteine--tRNA ligase, partial [Candidatus Cybelea sp.]
MALKLYNTRTRSVEAFEPLRSGEARVYVCGLTPSAQAHLGHARSFLFFDVLRRYLAHRGYRVTYV